MPKRDSQLYSMSIFLGRASLDLQKGNATSLGSGVHGLVAFYVSVKEGQAVNDDDFLELGIEVGPGEVPGPLKRRIPESTDHLSESCPDFRVYSGPPATLMPHR